MEALIALLVLVALGALALRFGHDSRDGLYSAEHESALRGARSTDRPAVAVGSAKVSVAQPSRPQQPIAGADEAPNPYPTLARIDHARGTASPALSAAANAAVLETHARSLAAEYWGDAVWLTGLVSRAAFRRVVEELEALRIDEVGSPGAVDVDTSMVEPLLAFGSAVGQVARMAPEILPRAS